MPPTDAQKQEARKRQDAAAHDPAAHVRIIAGPGTGKSFAIEERVRWLLSKGTPPSEIFVVSFTRASALDLQLRILTDLRSAGVPSVDKIHVSTFHSLGLRALRAAGMLAAYPADPVVTDDWEVKHVFDKEFGDESGWRVPRCEEIRKYHEAFWSTGGWSPPNYSVPKTPVTAAESASFDLFHRQRTQLYSCLLPGEIVGKCVEFCNAGILNPVALLKIGHLIVDEYQDLNPKDLELVDWLAGLGATLFVAGDDDQSVYSFRYACPEGIQSFPRRYPLSSDHTLLACFRCTPTVLAAGSSVMIAYAGKGRIPKACTSVYTNSDPPVQGITHMSSYTSGAAEANAVVESCRDLVQAGMNPDDIMVLVSDRNTPWQELKVAFQKYSVPFAPPEREDSEDDPARRLVLSLTRIVCKHEDYLAHRVLLGLLHGVGVGTCREIGDAVLVNNLNYREIFYQPLPAGVFSGRPLSALNRARSACLQVSAWQPSDTLGQHAAELAALIDSMLAPGQLVVWGTLVSSLPDAMTLQELRDYLWRKPGQQQEAVLSQIHARLGLAPIIPTTPPAVRVLTMHGAKGLSARVVFIPGLEEEILPAPRAKLIPGLVLEAARLLYMSITRAKAACVMSYSGFRYVYGKSSYPKPSRFCAQLGRRFQARAAGLTPDEVTAIMAASDAL